MAKETLYTAIDLGTTKVCTIIARVGAEGELQVLGLGSARSAGMQKGMVVNIGEVQEAIRASLDEAQRYLGKGVSWAYVGITGSHVTSMNRIGVLQGLTEDETLTQAEIDRAIQSSYPTVEAGREVLHVIPRGYVVDGLRGIRNPVGLHADRVEVEAHVVMAEVPPLRNIVKAVEGVGVSPRALVLEPLASGEAVLAQDEKEMGVILVDIGGGTSDVAIYLGGSLWHTTVIPVGGYQFTRDMSIAMNIPHHVAEEIKLKWGHALPETIDEEEQILLPRMQGGPKRPVSRREVCAPLHERAKELLKMVVQRAHQAGLEFMPPGGIVFTGGAASLPGLVELARSFTPSPVRVGAPRNFPGLPQDLRRPEYATSVGILLWGIKHYGEGRGYKTNDRGLWSAPFRRRKEDAATPA